jgi:O-succinylbenzoate synthase
LKSFTLPGDVSASKRYWKEDIIEPAVEVSPEGMITVPQTAGRGFKIKSDLIEKLTVRKQTLRTGAGSAAR